MKGFAVLALLACFGLETWAKETSANRRKISKLTPSQIEEKELKEAEQFERERAEAAHLAKQMEKDERKPTKANVSGRWSTGPNLVGMDFQLEQAGEKITGRGFHWGCLGFYSTFKISGNYRGERLVFTVTESNGEKFTCQFTYTEQEKYPRFQSTRTQFPKSFITHFETVERDATNK